MFQNKSILFILFAGIFLGGCLPSAYYQKDYSVPENMWQVSFQPQFDIQITDTNAVYGAYLILRHTDAYPYSNMWAILHIKKPNDTVDHPVRVEIKMAEASGKWMGRGMGEIYEQRLPIDIRDSTLFHKKGTWQIRLEQNMRTNPLPEILQVGLRVEKQAPGAMHNNIANL